MRNYSLDNYHIQEEWQRVPTLVLRRPDVTFHHPMSYPHYIKPYTLQDGVSVARLAAFLAHVPDLRRLTLSGQVRSFASPLLAHNAQLRHLFLDSPTCSEVSTDLLVPVPRLQELTMQCQLWELPVGFLDHTPELRSLDIQFADYFKYNPYVHVEQLPLRLLAHVPHLVRLCLHGGSLYADALPPDLFHYTPRLKAVAVPGVTKGVADCANRDSF